MFLLNREVISYMHTVIIVISKTNMTPYLSAIGHALVMYLHIGLIGAYFIPL